MNKTSIVIDPRRFYAISKIMREITDHQKKAIASALDILDKNTIIISLNSLAKELRQRIDSISKEVLQSSKRRGDKIRRLMDPQDEENEWRNKMQKEPPTFDITESTVYFSQRILSGKAWSKVEKLLGPNYLVDLENEQPGTVTIYQLFWLANTKYENLEPYTKEIYTAISQLGYPELIPIDNWKRAER